MTKTSSIQEYHKYHTDRDNTRIGLYTALNESFDISKVMYAGSYTDITPSLVFASVVYIDSYSKAQKFFDSPEVTTYIRSNKQYDSEAEFRFCLSDYTIPLPEQDKSFDLLVSQYGGFVSKACLGYLKPGGILVANNSHGDADWARLSGEYDFVGVYKRISDDRYTISAEALDSYFVPKKGQPITLQDVEAKGSGYGYTKTPSGYIFAKKSV